MSKRAKVSEPPLAPIETPRPGSPLDPTLETPRHTLGDRPSPDLTFSKWEVGSRYKLVSAAPSLPARPVRE
jgi:hypothetical protein